MTPADIRDLRQSLSLTQRELASLVSVSRETIARWERDGGSRPQFVHMQRLRELAAKLAPVEVS